MPKTDWARILEVERLIQSHFPECVLVGGTAAAIHAHHRASIDADSVLANLRETFPEVLATLEGLGGWTTSRLRPPVLILGQLNGVDVGIRQLVRSEPLETEEIEGIRLPTLAEMLRIKGYLIVARNALRDHIDFCALADKIGLGFEAAMASFDRLYPQPEDSDSTSQQLCRQLAQPGPNDLPADLDLEGWRDLVPPWQNWPYVERYCQRLAERLFMVIMSPGKGEGGS